MLRLIVVLLSVLCALPSPVLAAGLTPEQARDVEALIERHLLAHPEILERARKALETKRLAAQANADADAVRANHALLFADPRASVGGNPDGDVTVVEFLDYRCGVCRRVHPVIAQLLAEDGDIRILYRDWPVLGPDSVFAARAALAARRQGKYLAFQDALLKSSGKLPRDEVLRIAASVGIDIRRLESDIAGPEPAEILRDTYALAEALNLRGTPSFVIGERLVRGGRGLAAMKRLVAEARAARSAPRGN